MGECEEDRAALLPVAAESRDNYGAEDVKQPERSAAAAPEGTASVPGTVANLTKNVVGAGILTLPLAFKESSLAFAVPLIALSATLFGFTFWVTSVVAEREQVFTFRELWSRTLGDKSKWIVELFLVLNGFITCSIYMISSADFLSTGFEGLGAFTQPVKGSGEFNLPRILIICVTAVLLMPLCLLKNLSALKYTSLVGLAATAYTIVFVVVDAAGHPGFGQNLEDHGLFARVGLFGATAQFASAFAAHYNAPRFYGELKGRSPRRFGVVVMAAFGAALSVFLLFAICGLGRWGAVTQGNLLKNWAGAGAAAIVMWLGMAFSVLFTFPLVFNGARESFFGLLTIISGALGREPLLRPEGASRIAVTVGAISAIALLAAVVDELNVVNGLKGAICSNCICLAFPALIFLRHTGSKGRVSTVMSWGILVFAVITCSCALAKMFFIK